MEIGSVVIEQQVREVSGEQHGLQVNARFQGENGVAHAGRHWTKRRLHQACCLKLKKLTMPPKTSTIQLNKKAC